MNNYVQLAKKGLGSLAAVYLIYNFFVHGMAALLGSPGMTMLIQESGFPASQLLVRIVGALDIAAAVALFTYRKWWVSLYTGLWPLIPMTLTGITAGTWDFSYLQFPIIALVMYSCLDWRSKKQLR